jgi:hypothetical protein
VPAPPRARPATAEPARLQWPFDADVAVTGADLDFFMFVTPYVMPPSILADLLAA